MAADGRGFIEQVVTPSGRFLHLFGMSEEPALSLKLIVLAWFELRLFDLLMLEAIEIKQAQSLLLVTSQFVQPLRRVFPLSIGRGDLGERGRPDLRRCRAWRVVYGY